MTENTYNSRIDASFLVLTSLLLIGLLFRGLMLLRFDTVEALMVFGALALLVIVLLLFCYPCRYVFEADHLLIQSGALRFQVDYADVTRIEPSRSLWSGPALSLERVRIDHDGRFVLVSPMRRERFMAELQARVDAARGSLPPRQ